MVTIAGQNFRPSFGVMTLPSLLDAEPRRLTGKPLSEDRIRDLPQNARRPQILRSEALIDDLEGLA